MLCFFVSGTAGGGGGGGGLKKIFSLINWLFPNILYIFFFFFFFWPRGGGGAPGTLKKTIIFHQLVDPK